MKDDIIKAMELLDGLISDYAELGEIPGLLIDGLNDYYEYLQRAISAIGIKPLSMTSLKRKPEESTGWIYFAQNTKTRYVKIGLTGDDDPRIRINGLAGKHNLLIAIGTRLTIAEERRWQGIFWDKWVEGEYYRLTANDIRKVLKIAWDENRELVETISFYEI